MQMSGLISSCHFRGLLRVVLFLLLRKGEDLTGFAEYKVAGAANSERERRGHVDAPVAYKPDMNKIIPLVCFFILFGHTHWK